jgi:YHYH protein
VGSGETFLTSSVDGLVITDKSMSCTLESETGTTTGKCMKVTTTTLANHVMGPWCSGGFWDKKNVQFPEKSSTISSCMCQRYDCDGTCDDMCMECTPIAHERTYIIPLTPVVESEDSSAVLLGAHDDNNFGDGLALNGVPLAKADPYSELMDQNNIAPLDPNGGHSTLQLTYHYHAIPTIFFTCQTGWDPTNLRWAESAPDKQHSPLIGWGLDGLPIFGPFSDGGAVPTDLDDCLAHSHGEYGWHYHAGFDGEHAPAFVGCYKGMRAVQDWDDWGGFNDDQVRGATATCPSTTYTTFHSMLDSQSKYFVEVRLCHKSLLLASPLARADETVPFSMMCVRVCACCPGGHVLVRHVQGRGPYHVPPVTADRF